ncbi:TRAP-T-associated universal stress protein TeaD [Andreesenia angusta]|uniref:TRAP-T-associated universal stress protein TeaD n=1 Tax=Andreesenia angusta TaxID=39480 RepID=A0A1S1V7S7_9FIRM|nr:universal stress protein [Andreesenia angusta]OHW61769.1 TRAP-T-associated universal stress protein TeaD [Andreesenia angusta]
MSVKKILLPLDGSKRSLDAINMIKSLFGDSELDIHILHVVETEYITVPGIQEKANEISKDILDKAADLLAGYSTTKIGMSGVAYKDIVEYADKEKVDMIVMTRTGISGLQRYLVGSVTSKVISGSSVPVLIVPESD